VIQIAKCQNPSEIQRLHLLLVDIEVDVEDNEEDQEVPLYRRPRLPLPLPPTATSTTTSSATIFAGDLEKLQVLGHGNGDTVYKVRHKRTGAFYALKVVHGESETDVSRQVRREMEILCRTDSPHVVRCHGTFEKPSGDIAILMEYINVGTLDSLLKTHGSHGTFSEPKLADVARQILNAAERRGEEEENGRRRKKSKGRREEEKMIGFFLLCFYFLLFTVQLIIIN
jgi:serine/threonine protein kinase